MKKLPNKPSALIRLAVNNLIACENDENYIINMDVWHMRGPLLKSEYVCYVCFGGAIMAKTLKSDLYELLAPEDFNIKNSRKLFSLDFFRQGLIHFGLNTFYGKTTNIGRMQKNIEITSYSNDAKKFKSDMNRIADYLEKHGF